MNMSKVARSGKTSDAQVSKGSVSVSAALLVLISVLTAALVNAETYSSNPHKGLEEKISAALSGGGAPVQVQNVKKKRITKMEGNQVMLLLGKIKKLTMKQIIFLAILGKH